MSAGFDLELRLERRLRSGEPFVLELDCATPGGITVVFGPSGSGKTSLLHAVLGSLTPATGRIRAAGRAVFDSTRGVDLPIRERRIGMVFQDALLFPHLDVRRNVAFAVRGADRDRTARRWLDRVSASELARRMPGELSGGERQRVALARALAAEPRALLLDEPFSALDAPSRESLGHLLLELHDELRIPFLHVTHDLGEALRLGEELLLLSEGRLVQGGPPLEVVSRPASVAAAGAVGTENRYVATILRHDAEDGCTEIDLGGTPVRMGILELPEGARVTVGLRAEDVLVCTTPPGPTSARNLIPGTIESVAQRGTAIEVRVRTPVSFRILVTRAAVRELELAPGKTVHLLIKAAAFHRLV